jgi:hypothetical protein
MHLLTGAIGAAILVLTGLLVLALLALALVWVARQLLRLLLAVLVEVVTSATEAKANAETHPRTQSLTEPVQPQPGTHPTPGAGFAGASQPGRWRIQPQQPGRLNQPSADPNLN